MGVAISVVRSCCNVRITRAVKPYVPQTFHSHYRRLRQLVLRWTSSPKSYQDRVHAADVREIESGRLKPTHIYAAMMKRPSGNPIFYKQLTPEFSVRIPDKYRVNGKTNVR
jgi:hypothetical protein